MTTAHPIDTGAASCWRLVGRPFVFRYFGSDVSGFVQRSWISGRPWLRFALKLDPASSSDLWYVRAYPTKRQAILGY